MTRPLDLLLYASVRGVMPGAKSESLAETCKAFAAENHDALAAKGGIRAGKLKVWIAVKRELHAMIVE